MHFPWILVFAPGVSCNGCHIVLQYSDVSILVTFNTIYLNSFIKPQIQYSEGIVSSLVKILSKYIQHTHMVVLYIYYLITLVSVLWRYLISILWIFWYHPILETPRLQYYQGIFKIPLIVYCIFFLNLSWKYCSWNSKYNLHTPSIPNLRYLGGILHAYQNTLCGVFKHHAGNQEEALSSLIQDTITILHGYTWLSMVTTYQNTVSILCSKLCWHY